MYHCNKIIIKTLILIGVIGTILCGALDFTRDFAKMMQSAGLYDVLYVTGSILQSGAIICLLIFTLQKFTAEYIKSPSPVIISSAIVIEILWCIITIYTNGFNSMNEETAIFTLPIFMVFIGIYLVIFLLLAIGFINSKYKSLGIWLIISPIAELIASEFLSINHKYTILVAIIPMCVVLEKFHEMLCKKSAQSSDKISVLSQTQETKSPEISDQHITTETPISLSPSLQAKTRIKCPYCGEDIAATAKKCRFCGEWLPTAAAPAQQPMQQPVQQPVYQPLTQTPPPITQTPLQQPINTDTTHPLNDTPEIDTSTLPSFFEEYFVKPYIRQYADFKSCTGRKAFWLAVLALLIVNTGVTGLAMLIIGLSGMSMEALLAAGIICGLWSLAMIVPGIAICCRRLRDAGKRPWLYLLGLIPLVGPIILLVFLCQESQYDHSEENAKFKPVDIIITAVSIILLVGGIISLGKSVSDMLGGMNGYDAEYYIDNSNENGECVMEDAYDGSDTSEILSNDYSKSQIIPETDSEFGFSNGINFLEGNMISKKGQRFPFTLQFSYDTSTGEISNVIYRNVNYNVTIKLTGHEDSYGNIVMEGKDGRKPFIIQFTGNGSYTGDAWSGDFHQDIELFKQ